MDQKTQQVLWRFQRDAKEEIFKQLKNQTAWGRRQTEDLIRKVFDDIYERMLSDEEAVKTNNQKKGVNHG